MALFKKFKEALGTPDAKLLTEGVPAWGAIEDVQLGGATVTIGVDQYRVCSFRLQVRTDGQQPYTATAKQRVHELALARLSGQPVCVRVDPADPQRVQIDFDSPAPVVTVPQRTDGTGLADVLARGEACEVVVTQAAQPIGLRSHDGHDIVAFHLTVVPVGAAPYEVQVAMPHPASALPYVHAGARLPARRLPEQADAVVIDWDAAAAHAAA